MKSKKIVDSIFEQKYFKINKITYHKFIPKILKMYQISHCTLYIRNFLSFENIEISMQVSNRQLFYKDVETTSFWGTISDWEVRRKRSLYSGRNTLWQLLKRVKYMFLHIKFQDNFSFHRYDFDKYETSHIFIIRQIITRNINFVIKTSLFHSYNFGHLSWCSAVIHTNVALQALVATEVRIRRPNYIG